MTREADGRILRGPGSGVIIEPSGLILTAEHVVRQATSLQVLLRNGESFPARVAGIDRVYDVALIRIETHRPLPTVSLGSSGLLKRRDPVTAFGRAPRRQFGPTMGTFGEVDLEVRPGVPFLRATAIAWPGDSGGALVNSRGEMVGMIEAFAASHRDWANSVSLASDAIKSILRDLHTKRVVRHTWLGIVGITLTTELSQELGLAVHSGVLILQVAEGGPSALAGLRGGRATSSQDIPRGGDVITAVDGRPAASLGALTAYILGKHIGDVVVLEVNRDGQVFTTPVVLGESPTL